MAQSGLSRRLFVRTLLVASGGVIFSGCGEDKQLEAVRQADPNVVAKDSMDYYKNTMLKKKKARR